MKEPKYKIFDWALAYTLRSPKRIDWLRENFKKSITQDEYVVAMQSLKPFKIGKGRSYKPHVLRKDYKNLATRFGFFKPSL